MSVISLSGLFSLLCILLMLTEADSRIERGKAGADLSFESAVHKIRPLLTQISQRMDGICRGRC